MVTTPTSLLLLLVPLLLLLLRVTFSSALLSKELCGAGMNMFARDLSDLGNRTARLSAEDILNIAIWAWTRMDTHYKHIFEWAWVSRLMVSGEAMAKMNGYGNEAAMRACWKELTKKNKKMRVVENLKLKIEETSSSNSSSKAAAAVAAPAVASGACPVVLCHFWSIWSIWYLFYFPGHHVAAAAVATAEQQQQQQQQLIQSSSSHFWRAVETTRVH
jgi:hypothetical protein